MTKTVSSLMGGQFASSFEHLDFGSVSDFGFRYSDFTAIPAPVELLKPRIELMGQRTSEWFTPRSSYL
jgi:hypothetical protein